MPRRKQQAPRRAAGKRHFENLSSYLLYLYLLYLLYPHGVHEAQWRRHGGPCRASRAAFPLAAAEPRLPITERIASRRLSVNSL